MHFRSFLLFLCTVLLLFVVSGTVNAQNNVKENEKLSIYLGWSHQFQFAGYYAAVEQGYFKEAGYEVELIPETQEYDFNLVINGTYNYGVATGAALLGAKNFDKLVVIAAIYQQSPVSLIALKSNGINNISDLKGGDIVAGNEIKAMLVSAGLDLDSVNIHGSSSSFNALITGKYDAITYFINDKTKLLGNDSLLFNIFRPIEYGVNFYGESLYTSKEEVRNHPERVVKVRDAVIKGWAYAIEHKDEVIDLIIEKYNPELSRAVLASEAETVITTLIQPRFYDIGDMQFSKWEQMANLLYSLGVTPQKRNLEGFIFSPPLLESERLDKLITIGSVVLSLAAIVLLVLLVYNWQLKKAVNTRTMSLAKANEEMDRFVYSISHDIRSPLSSMQGLVNLIRADPDNSNRYLELINASIVKLEKYTKDILDYTRNSRAKITLKQIDLGELVDKCIDQIKYSEKSQRIHFEKQINFDSPVWADAWRLEVILNNLLGNAAKYMDKDRENPRIVISANLKNNNLMITITDNGCGIPAEHQGKIFNMFYRASEDSQGSGMGLFIVKETISLLNGTIRIDSTVGVGTTVYLTLPNKKTVFKG